MTKPLPAGLDCIGCHYCEVRPTSTDRNILVCVSTSTTKPDPLDVTRCYAGESANE
jgi:hypothetical protein